LPFFHEKSSAGRFSAEVDFSSKNGPETAWRTNPIFVKRQALVSGELEPAKGWANIDGSLPNSTGAHQSTCPTRPQSFPAYKSLSLAKGERKLERRIQKLMTAKGPAGFFIVFCRLPSLWLRV